MSDPKRGVLLEKGLLIVLATKLIINLNCYKTMNSILIIYKDLF